MFNQTSPQAVEMIASHIAGLSKEEVLEIDQAITPRIPQLLAKAFGPRFYELLSPFTENDPPEERSAAEDALREMMRDPRYWRDRDPSYVNRVSNGFKRLYPGDEQLAE